MEAGSVKNIFGYSLSIDVRCTHIVIFILSLSSIIVGFSPSFFDTLDIVWIVGIMTTFCAIGTILWIRENHIDTEQKRTNIFTAACLLFDVIAIGILMIYFMFIIMFSNMSD
jgi:hypothetical protein